MEPSSLHQGTPGWQLPPDVAQVSHSRTDSKEPQMFPPGGFQKLAYPVLHHCTDGKIEHREGKSLPANVVTCHMDISRSA